MATNGASVTCRNCGYEGIWSVTPNGKWRVFEQDGKPHMCPKGYGKPVERSDEYMLARQVARLATAIEDLVIELRERRAT